MTRTRRATRDLLLLIGAASMAACASAPEPDPQTATVWGYVRLVPKKDAPRSGGGYGDRRLADVKRFDYSHLRYAVVFAEDAPPRAVAPLELTIREGRGAPRIEPAFSHSTISRGVSIRNDTDRDQIVSAPGAGWLSRVKAGESTRLDGLSEGELTLHVLGGSRRADPNTSLVWLSEGMITEVDAAGRYVLEELEPGRHALRAWHPRLPPTKSFTLDLSRGDVRRLDLEIGVDAGDLHDGGAQ